MKFVRVSTSAGATTAPELLRWGGLKGRSGNNVKAGVSGDLARVAEGVILGDVTGWEIHRIVPEVR